MRADGFDAVVVGSGPNGLVAALTMAEAGCRTLLVEAADRIGGGLRTEELTLPGFRHDVCASVLPLAVASPAFRSLLPKIDGVRWLHPPVPAAHPLNDAPAVLVHRSLQTTVDELGRDGAAWDRTVGASVRAGTRLVDTLLAPLDLPPKAPFAAARFGALALPPATWLARAAFREPRARAAFAGMAAHSMLSLGAPISAGYGLLLATLAHQVGWPVVAGGVQSLADAMSGRLLELGGEIVTGTPVRSLGDLPPAASTLLDVGPEQLLAIAGCRLPAGYRRRLSRFRRGPGVFKLDWALDAPVPWRDPEVARAGTVHLGGTVEEIAYGEGEVAQGRHPARPYVLVVQPGAADPDRAPQGRHVLWAYCHVPNGSTVDMTAAVEAQVERFAPGFRDRILARSTMDTAAFQRHNGNLVGGDIAGGAGDLRQFFARPTWSSRPWQTPIPGVYLCSASTPPGAGVHGMGGWQAARLALRRQGVSWPPAPAAATA